MNRRFIDRKQNRPITRSYTAEYYIIRHQPGFIELSSKVPCFDHSSIYAKNEKTSRSIKKTPESLFLNMKWHKNLTNLMAILHIILRNICRYLHIFIHLEDLIIDNAGCFNRTSFLVLNYIPFSAFVRINTADRATPIPQKYR